MRTTLFVAGFGTRTRARDLAYEFERYGRLVRCDIPAPKTFTAKVYAFVEFEDPHDAEDAFNEMHGRRIDGYTISVQWARNAPSASWRLGGPTTPPNPPPPPPHHLTHDVPCRLLEEDLPLNYINIIIIRDHDHLSLPVLQVLFIP
ncbi:uncharacterized protein EV154DRAFT_547017 [Mucor mucedo]|uniref:uncharacterized protein n=1 Tax=Mucor mucedo TaxID=29922 RepID=UPI00221FF803|nr:uncharacterized protein EV154DRAFT_547017 [Mucor mucedo]KAI7896740.1 hypothetical protein EV154DRAFT_547017 [Mucor mucedo]